MNRIQKMYQHQSANFRLSHLCLSSHRQSTNLSHKSPSQQQTLDTNLHAKTCVVKTNILAKMITKMYDQFHYIDQVTFKKTNMKNLCLKRKIKEKGNCFKGVNSEARTKNYSKSCEDIGLGTKKQEFNQNPALRINSMDERETMKSFNSLQHYIQQIKRIKQFRMNQLTTKRQKYLQKKTLKLQNRKVKRYSESAGQSDEKVRGSLTEKGSKQRKIIKEIKKKIYQINIQQFRKYCNKQQKFDPKKQRVLELSSNVDKYLERPTQSKWSEYKKCRQQKLRRQKIKNSQSYDNQFETLLSNQVSQFGKLIRMRIRHETQFNWQRNKMI